MTQKWYKKASVQTAIISGIFILVAAIITGIFGLHQVILRKKNINITSNQNTIHPPSDTSKLDTLKYEREDYDKYKYFSENQIRVEISKSLREENVDKAIELLKYLTKDESKEEEYDHIFNYCIKNNKLDKAEIVAKLFNSPAKRKNAKKTIAREKYKRNRK